MPNVTRDANSPAPIQVGNTVPSPQDVTGLITVGASAKALIVELPWDELVGLPPNVSLTWDQGGTNQAMTLIKSQAPAVGTRVVQIWGLLNPTAGSKTLRIAWTGGGNAGVIVNATSYNDVDTSSFAAAFVNATSATGNSGTVALTITSAPGHLTIDCFGAQTSTPTPTQTQLFFLSGSGPDDGGSSEGAGAATVQHDWSITSSQWATVGCSIAKVPDGTAEQEGFRFVNDDGSESGSSFPGDQDANVTKPSAANLRLRVLSNFTGDVPSYRRRLEYRRAGQPGWRIVER